MRVVNNELRSKVISDEVQRIVNLFGKAYLDCDDLVKLTGLGKENVRELMHSGRFPVLTVGKRQIVSIVQFVMWQFDEM